MIEQTGKPLTAVLLTHAHVDHYGGAFVLKAQGAELIAGRGVARQLVEFDAITTRASAYPSPREIVSQTESSATAKPSKSTASA
jgi:glyoxylase-like metal-dependent hydrolase (beta-lactamase superfamily II)